MKKPIHPQLPDQPLELAWEAGEEKFYRFKEISHLISKGRGVFLTTYLQTLEKFKVTPEAFQNWKEAMRNALIPVGGKLRIDLAHRLIDQLEEREYMFSSIEAGYKIQILTTFKLDDDLKTEPSYEEQERRKKLLKKKKTEEIWQMKPLKGILDASMFLRNFSLTHSKNPLKVNEALIQNQEVFWMRMAAK